jgi:hypothetical protein
MKVHRISNAFKRLSVCGIFGLLCVCLLAACSSQPSEKNRDNTAPNTEVLKPSVEIRNEALAALARQFPSVKLPYDTRSDSVMPTVSPLRDADLKVFIRKGSAFEYVNQCYPLRRLPDYGNFVALIYATLQQESGGLRVLLVTYTPEGRPIDELILKDDSDTGEEYTLVNTVINADFSLEKKSLVVRYESTGLEDEIREKERKEQMRRYTISPEGKIMLQP